MPRTPDPNLEERLAKAALRLLDTAGLSAVTLRAVAVEAATTTPTIYERFANRDKLLESVHREAELEMLGVVRHTRSVTEFAKRSLEFGVEHPHRFEMNVDTFGFRLAAGQPMPVYELLKEQLTSELGVFGPKREQLALAVVSLILGATRGIIATGAGTPAGKDLQRTCLAALQLLLKAFSG